jgi:hypothetical protein
MTGNLIFNGGKVLDLVKPFIKAILISILVSIPVYIVINCYSEEINHSLFYFKGYTVTFTHIGEKHSAMREMSGSITFLVLFVPLLFLGSILVVKNYYKDRQMLNFYLNQFIYLKFLIFFVLMISSFVLGIKLFNWDMENQFLLDEASKWEIKTQTIITYDEMMKSFRFWVGWTVLNFVCITTISYLLFRLKSLFDEYFRVILIFLFFIYLYLLFSKVNFWLFEKWGCMILISAVYFITSYYFFILQSKVKFPKKETKKSKSRKYYL